MYHQKRYHKQATPTRFPAVVTFQRGDLEFEFRVKTLEAHEAFKLNARNINGGALRAIAERVGNGGLESEQIREALDATAQWREKLEFKPDGSEETCVVCSKRFQPVLIPWRNQNTGEEGFGGNFMVVKGERLSSLSPEAIKVAEEMTARTLGPGDKPAKTVMAAVCPGCREDQRRHKVFIRYYSREAAVEELFRVDDIIVTAENRRKFAETMYRGGDRRGGDRRQQNNRPVHDQRQGGDRREEERQSWHGCQFYVQTAEALTKAAKDGKIGDSAEALAAMEPARLLELGIVSSDKAAEHVLRVANIVATRRSQTAAAAHEGAFSLGDIAGPLQVEPVAPVTTPKKTPERRSKSRR